MFHPTVSSPVTRRVWSSPDAILLFFAGGAAEFAAIKAVDWLFFTGRLPEAPVERFFQTVRFAQRVFFGDPAQAAAAIEAINRIHRRVEEARGEEIPQWAYRDMLFILIDYGERAHEVVFGPMTEGERRSHFGAALALGRVMGLSGLPTTYAAYKAQRHRQLLEDYARTRALRALPPGARPLAVPASSGGTGQRVAGRAAAYAPTQAGPARRWALAALPLSARGRYQAAPLARRPITGPVRQTIA
jgi:uncharacterized protein (DUF2236 family)